MRVSVCVDPYAECFAAEHSASTNRKLLNAEIRSDARHHFQDVKESLVNLCVLKLPCYTPWHKKTYTGKNIIAPLNRPNLT